LMSGRGSGPRPTRKAPGSAGNTHRGEAKAEKEPLPMTTIFDSAHRVKSAPQTFRRGIPPADRRPLIPHPDDLDWAAKEFAENEAEHDCVVCGRSDAEHGLCPDCELRAEEDSIACINQLHGLGRRVF